MRLIVVVASLLLALCPSAYAGQIYKWVDAQGVTHFDAQPPSGQKVVPVQGARPVPAPGAAPLGASSAEQGEAEQRKIDRKVKSQVEEQEARRREFCTTARTNVAQLKNNPRVREEVDGELRRLTEKERQARIDEAQGLIAEQCN